MESLIRPLVIPPGEGKEITVGGSRLFVKLFSGAVSDKFSITEYELSAHFPGPPPHKHKVFEHAWYVLEGSLTVQLEAETSTLTKGGFVFIPKMTVHAFSNRTDSVVKLLAVDTPGGFENYYDDLEAAFGDGGTVDLDVMRAIQLKYDTYRPSICFECPA